MKIIKKITEVLVVIILLGACQIFASAEALPTDGLDLWLEADYGVTVNSNGKISSWQSKIRPSSGGTPYVLDEIGTESGSAPTVEITEFGTKTIRFNGKSIKHTLDEQYNGEFSIICLINTDNPNAYPSTGYALGLGGCSINISKNGYSLYSSQTGSSPTGFSAGSLTDNFVALMATSEYNSSNPAYRSLYTYQNNQKIEGPFVTNANRKGYDYISRFSIGAKCYDQICAMLIYNRVLSEEERTQVYHYLSNKYLTEIEIESAVICEQENEIVLTFNVPLKGNAEIDDFTVSDSNGIMNICSTNIDEYGNVVLSISEDVERSDSLTIMYSGDSLLNYSGQTISDFSVATNNVVEKILLKHNKGVTSDKWIDVSGNYSYELQKGSIDVSDDYITFNKESLMHCNNAINGEQTGFAVVRINQIGRNDKLFGDEFCLNSVALSSYRCVSDDKKLDYIKENRWTLIAWRIKTSEGKKYLEVWINNKKSIDGVEIDDVFSITDIGEGHFDIKSLYISNDAMEDIRFKTIQNSIADFYLSNFVNVDKLEYNVTDESVIADITFSSPAFNDIRLIAALKTADNRLEKVEFKDISNATEHNERIVMPYSSESRWLQLFIWEGETIAPLTENRDFWIREIDTEVPVSTWGAESNKTIPEFSASLPQLSEMNLKLNGYQDVGVNYLNAKGYLPESWDYVADQNMSEDAFAEILENITGVNVSKVNSTTFKGKDALVDIYRALKPLYMVYNKNDSYNLTAILSGLNNEETLAFNTALHSGIASDTFPLLQQISSKDACDLLAKVVINFELYDINRGAEIPYKTYHSQYADYNGTLTESNIELDISSNPDNIAYEALGKKCVTLDSVGEYINFKNLFDANKVIVSFSIPKLTKEYIDNTAKPSDDIGTISVYLNNTKVKTVELHSLPLYTQRYWNESSKSYYYVKYFTEFILDIEINSNDSLMFKIDDTDVIPDEDDFSEGISINYIRLEEAGTPNECPEDYVDATVFGANGEDIYDDTNALQNAIEYAHRHNQGVFIPQGTYYVGNRLQVLSDTTIKGAGMWNTVILSTVDNTVSRGGRTGFTINGNDITISDLKISGSVDYKRGNYTSPGISGKGNNIIIKNVWIDKMPCGIWAELYNSNIISCRITNTFADGIHMSHESQGNTISDCIIYGCGDDGIATSSGVSRGIVSSDNLIKNNTIGQIYWGRGIMLSGNANTVVENNVINGIYRNNGMLIWTEANYDTLSAYDITIKENVVSNSTRGTGWNRGQISIFTNRNSTDFWTDADLYDNEIYKTLLGHNVYVTDTTDGRVYAEISNNVLHQKEGINTVSSVINSINSNCLIDNNLDLLID